MSSESHSAHEDIHLPPPSWAPLIVGLGTVVLASGLLFWPLFPIGLLIFLFGVWKLSNFTLIEELKPSMGVNSRVLGMWVFLASEIMFFSGLISTFLGYRSRTPGARSLLDVPLMTVGTFILLSSSFGAVSALSAVREGRFKAYRNWIIATMVMGAAFLLIEGLEWAELINEGITTGTLFGSAFFTLTGFHGLHVLTGLGIMALLLVRYYLGKVSVASTVSVELFGLYWHFVDIVWIILFTIIYLLK